MKKIIELVTENRKKAIAAGAGLGLLAVGGIIFAVVKKKGGAVEEIEEVAEEFKEEVEEKVEEAATEAVSE